MKYTKKLWEKCWSLIDGNGSGFRTCEQCHCPEYRQNPQYPHRSGRRVTHVKTRLVLEGEGVRMLCTKCRPDAKEKAKPSYQDIDKQLAGRLF